MAKGRRHNRKNKDYVILERRLKVARMYCEGKSQHEIAKAMDRSIAAVSKDLAEIRTYWLSLMMADFDQVKSEQLAKIDYLEAQAWKGWRRSCRPAESTTHSVEKGIRVEKQTRKCESCNGTGVISGRVRANGNKCETCGGSGKLEMTGKAPLTRLVPIKETKETRRLGQAGNPRFLEVVDRCIERRLKLMGLLEEKGDTTNVYLNFSDLLKQQQEQAPVLGHDVIENTIAQVGKEQVNGSASAAGVPRKAEGAGVEELGKGPQ